MPQSIDPSHLPRIADGAALALGWERWREKIAELNETEPALAAWMAGLDGDTLGGAVLGSVFANSPFLTQCCLFEAATVRALFTDGPDASLSATIAALDETIRGETDMARLMAALRLAKRRVALLTGLADICGLWGLDQVTGALSDFAATAIGHGLRFLLRRAAGRGDIALPHPETPEIDSGIVILGMGKLGAGELNYSSDIDIIVFYDHEKLTYLGRKTLGECLIALTRDLVKILDERTIHGYVFRTDLRLRPDPGSTPVAISMAAAELYYEGFGQNWERAAMIKAAQVGGDPVAGAAFLKFIKPFIWRKSLDFAAIQDIHSIKRQINAHRGGHSIAVAGHNIKLGRGGIREIEFFVQTQQLIWGGRLPALRGRRTLDALAALTQAGQVSPQAQADLSEAYHFLRRLEHRLQMIDDKQTQTLPDQPERLAGLAAFMGFADCQAFADALLARLGRVEQHYAALFEDAPPLATGGNLVFTGGENDPETVQTLATMGFAGPDAVCSTIRGWHHGRIRATRSTRARELLTELTPSLLKALAATANPDDAFLRLDEFLSRLPGGVPVFSLFYTNPSLLELVAELMGNAPLLAEHLARHVNLLDAVVTPSFFAPPPPVEALTADLAATLDQAGDVQEVLDLSRRWANDHRFQVGVQSLRGMLTPTQAAGAFTDIADAVLAGLAPRMEAELARVNGRVAGGQYCVLALGKMGGREMTATSDLDLILIYDCPDPTAESQGGAPLAVTAWYARLTQRIVNALSAKTPEGALYEVDMRLRPSGNAGPIATSFTAFDRYQQESAWTWEHMALTRARAIHGDAELVARVRSVIRRTLAAPRDLARLTADVADMRARMAREHKPQGRWDVKQRPGGLIDVEFIAQWLQLRDTAQCPDLPDTNTGQVLTKAVAAGRLSPADGDVLINAWRLCSAVQLVLRQTVAGAFEQEQAPAGLKQVLVGAAGLSDFKTLCDTLDDCTAASHRVFTALLDQPKIAETTPCGHDN